MTKEPMSDKLKRAVKILFWLIVFIALGLGFSEIIKALGASPEAASAGFAISLILIIGLGLKYEKMANEIYKWKNKDSIINPFNEHIYKKDDCK